MNNNTIKQVPIMNNCITVLIETLHKTSNIGSPQNQRIPKDNINTNHRDRNDNDSNGMRTQYGRLIKKSDNIQLGSNRWKTLCNTI